MDHLCFDIIFNKENRRALALIVTPEHGEYNLHFEWFTHPRDWVAVPAGVPHEMLLPSRE